MSEVTGALDAFNSNNRVQGRGAFRIIGISSGKVILNRI